MGYYNPNIHHRRSIRLKEYDYSQAGLYFVTIVCQNRKHLFGKIENKEMILNDAGKMVDSEWLKLPDRFKNIKLHEYTVMPNHFHGILEIVSQNKKTAINNNSAAGATLVVAPALVVAPNNNQKGQPLVVAPTKSGGKKKPTLGDIVGAFESITTVKYINGVKTKNWKRFDGKLWQRNYWEHIIRNEKSYNRITKYIKNNPANWNNDKFKK